jgi:hypothetical protein
MIRKTLIYLSLSVLLSCKVSLSGGNFGESKTISVAFFPNNSSLVQPTLSQSFTEDLRSFFQTQTPLSLTQRNGDLQFEGAITDYRINPVAIDNQTASSNRLTISVSVKFTNIKDPTKDFESTFSRFADFPSSENLGSIESDLIKQINQQLAQDIFNKAFINW